MTPAALANLHALCFETPRPWSEAEFAAILTTPGTYLCGDAHSFALGRVIADEAELLTLVVSPDKRRQGLGANVLRAFEAEAIKRHATRAFLEVAANNTPAIALYRAQGYSEEGRRPSYYRTPDGARIDALILSRDLAAD